MKIAVFGGTFNPVHMGHMHLLEECCKQYSFDKILLVPTNLPPHKAADGLISNEHRFNMLRLAAYSDCGNTEDEPSYKALLEVSDIEYRLGAKSYTINTLEELKKNYPHSDFFLIAGSDMLFTFEKWHRYEDILKSVTLIAGARHDAEYEKLSRAKKKFGKFSEKIQIINIEAVDISSTQIRQRIEKNLEVTGLVDEKVYEYIKENNLYKKIDES